MKWAVLTNNEYAIIPSMKTASGIYAVLYTLAITVTIVDDLRSGESRWETASDLILLPLGLVGILLYHFDVSNPGAKSAWRIVAPLIVAGQVFVNLLRRQEMKKVVPAEHRDAAVFSDIATPLLLLPMFITNLAYAFR